MNPRLLLALLSVCVPLCSFAQDETLPGLDAPAPPPAEDEARPVTLEDVRINIGAIVKTFVEQRSPDGFWPLKDKSSGQLRRLQLLAVAADKVKDEGKMRYSAPATLKDLEAEQTVRAVFIVSFRGPEWKVVGMKLLPPRARRAKPAE
jgi:hypothetical protein